VLDPAVFWADETCGDACVNVALACAGADRLDSESFPDGSVDAEVASGALPGTLRGAALALFGAVDAVWLTGAGVRAPDGVVFALTSGSVDGMEAGDAAVGFGAMELWAGEGAEARLLCDCTCAGG
jgi:hypothetical protein